MAQVDAAARPSQGPVVVAWTLWTLTMLNLAALPWLDRLVRGTGLTEPAVLAPDTVGYVLAVASAATVGAVLAGRRPGHPVGWLLLGLGLSVVVSGTITGYATYGLLARPGAVPGAAYLAIYPDSVAVDISATCIGFILLLTPTGALPSPRWRWWARVMVGALALGLVSSPFVPFSEPYQSVTNPLTISALSGPLGVLSLISFFITLLSVPVAAWSLVVRFRRARGVERLQLRWLALAAALVLAGVLTGVVLGATGHATPHALGWLSGICIAAVPLATGAAILRYRLYDLDRIISRTLAYAVLTLLLGGGYAIVVLGLGQLLGQGSNLVVAGATLALAAAFQPARLRVQRWVDRRFNRRRYDAARTITAFSTRLRDEIDLDTLSAELLAVVEETVQPTAVALWLRQKGPSGPRPSGARLGEPDHRP